MLIWLLCFELIGLLALPLTVRLFAHVPHHGIAWSKILGVLVVSWTAWLAAMLNLTAFNPVAATLGLIVLAGLSWLAWRGTPRQTIIAAVRQHWRRWLWYEILFMLLFWVGIQLRMHGAYGSAVQFTEKPMELMMLSSVVNSPSFPPNDLWLAGYSLNYYYFGYVVVGTVMTLSGVTLGMAFNLGIASIFALTGVAIAGIIASMIAYQQRDAGKKSRGWLGNVMSVLAIALVLLTGNQIGALQRITNSSYVNRLSDTQRISALTQALSGKQPITLDPATLKSSGEPVESTLKPMGQQFDWWAPSRAVYDNRTTGTIVVDGVSREGVIQDEVITEFPFFSFYLADLHPHVLAMPFVLLVIALAWAMLLRAGVPSFNQRGSRLEWFTTSLSIGCLYMLNSWDAPTYGFIFVLAMTTVFRRDVPQWTRRDWLNYAKQVGLVVLGAAVLFAPFLLTFNSFAGQTSVPAPFDKIPIIRSLGKIIGPALDHSSWTDLVAIFGLFLVPVIAWATQTLVGWREWLAVGSVLVLGLIIGVPALVFAPLAYLLIQAVFRHSNHATSFGLILAGVGALLIVVVDLIYLRDNFDHRFNTVFKVYFQVWLILGLVASYALWVLFSQAWWRRLGTVVWLPLFGVLLAGAAVYPVSILSPSTSPSWDVPPSLDGTLNSGYTNAGSRALADWLVKNAPSNAVIASAAGNSYNNPISGGEVASLSGHPTLLNWQGSHENLWRTKQPEARDELNVRANDLVQIYTNPDVVTVRQLLEKYKVTHLVLGPNERNAYPQNTGAIFEQVGEKVLDQDGWALYKVIK